MKEFIPRGAGKLDCGVCTDEQEPHPEAIRSDEVAHDAEVQHLGRGQYRNSRCSRNQSAYSFLVSVVPMLRSTGFFLIFVVMLLLAVEYMLGKE